MSLLSVNNPNQGVTCCPNNNNTNEREKCVSECENFQPNQVKIEESKSNLEESAKVDDDTFVIVLRRLSRERRVKQRSTLREIESSMEQNGHYRHQYLQKLTQPIGFHHCKEKSSGIDTISIEDNNVGHDSIGTLSLEDNNLDQQNGSATMLTDPHELRTSLARRNSTELMKKEEESPLLNVYSSNQIVETTMECEDIRSILRANTECHNTWAANSLLEMKRGPAKRLVKRFPAGGTETNFILPADPNTTAAKSA